MKPTRPEGPGRGAARLPHRAASHRSKGAGLNLLIIVVCAIALAFLWTSILQRIAFERSQAEAAAKHSNANLAIAYEQEIYRTLKAAEQVAAFARAQYLLQGTRLNLSDWTQGDLIRHEGFTILSIVNREGILVSSNQIAGHVNYADRAFFRAQRDASGDRLYIDQPLSGRVSGQWRIPMSLGIWQPGHRFDGVVVLSVDPYTFTDFYRQVELGRYGLLEVTGLDGTIRARQANGVVTFGQDARQLPWFRKRATASDGTFVDEGDATDGTRRIISYRTLTDYPLMVTVGTAYADIIQPAEQRHASYLLNASLATLALLAYSALLIFILARQRAISQALEASEARLAHAAMHDALTRLPNRVLFQVRCDRALATAHRRMARVVVLYIDLDGFKFVNDQHGHPAGDELLQQVARRLESCVRAGSEDTVSRFGGDEFGVILTDIQARSDSEAIAEKILVSLARPYDLKGVSVHISASIGLAAYPDHGRDTMTLTQLADIAMYTAKQAGRNRFCWAPDELPPAQPSPDARPD